MIPRSARLVWFSLDALPIIALGWVLLHLVLLLKYGSVTIVEENKTILAAEILVVIAGLARTIASVVGVTRRYVE